MTNYLYNESPDLQEARLREKQAKCNHPSLRCSVCHLYQDELCSRHRALQSVLEAQLRHYEALLLASGVWIIPYDDLCQGGIIEGLVEKEMKDVADRLQRHSE